jgi:hypothetical protein
MVLISSKESTDQSTEKENKDLHIGFYKLSNALQCKVFGGLQAFPT